jgi:hypothetical protein
MANDLWTYPNCGKSFVTRKMFWVFIIGRRGSYYVS